MDIPNVLALPLDEALARLAKMNIECEIEFLLPPREDSASYQGTEVRKYVVRQRMLSDDRIVLTVVYR